MGLIPVPWRRCLEEIDMIRKALISILLILPGIGFTSGSAKIVKMYATGSDSFVGLRDDGTITAWGNADFGGSIPQDVLSSLNQRNIKEIYPTNCAFAVLTDDGAVSTWGGSRCGGDSESVVNDLTSGVEKIFVNQRGTMTDTGAFAALKSDGSIVTWGNSYYGGDSSQAASQLQSGVVKVFSSSSSFAALKNDGSVVVWGNSDDFNSTTPYSTIGDVSLLVQSGVTDIFVSDDSFIAVKNNGQLVGWGNSGAGKDVILIAHNLEYSNSKVVDITCNNNACVALKDNGSVLIWGDEDFGGAPRLSIVNQLRGGVTKIVPGHGMFAVLKNDGTVVTWGGRGLMEDGVAREYRENSDYSLNPVKTVAVNISGVKVKDIFTNQGAFVALRENGSLVAWGLEGSGADNGTLAALNGTDRVASVYSSYAAFAALKENGSVITWGNANHGGDSTNVSSQLGSNIIDVVASYSYFSALKSDGTTVVWGGQ